MKRKITKNLKLLSLLGLGLVSIGVATPLIVSCSDDGDQNQQSSSVVSPEKNPEFGGTPDSSYQPTPEVESIISKKELEAANYGAFLYSDDFQSGCFFKIAYGVNNKYFNKQNFNIDGNTLIYNFNIKLPSDATFHLFNEEIKLKADQELKGVWKSDLTNIKQNKSWHEIITYTISDSPSSTLEMDFNVSGQNLSNSILVGLKLLADLGMLYTMNDDEKNKFIQDLQNNNNFLGMPIFHYDENNGMLYMTSYDYNSNKLMPFRLIYVKDVNNIMTLDLSKKVHAFGKEYDVEYFSFMSIELLCSDINNENFNVTKYFPNLNKIIIKPLDYNFVNVMGNIHAFFPWASMDNWVPGPNNTLVNTKK